MPGSDSARPTRGGRRNGRSAGSAERSGPLSMNRRRHDLAARPPPRWSVPHPSARVGPVRWGDAAGDDQSYPPPGALGVERSHPLETALSFLEAHVHGSHEHAVRQGDEAEVEGSSRWGRACRGLLIAGRGAVFSLMTPRRRSCAHRTIEGDVVGGNRGGSAQTSPSTAGTSPSTPAPTPTEVIPHRWTHARR